VFPFSGSSESVSDERRGDEYSSGCTGGGWAFSPHSSLLHRLATPPAAKE
jgi:hypothetical protein